MSTVRKKFHNLSWFLMNNKDKPFVSIVLAVRNEETHIQECLQALLNQDYPAEKFEIIVADGMSEDRTREIIEKLEKSNKGRIRLIDNPAKLAFPGLDKGIKAAKSDILGLIGGHTIAPSSLISTLSELLITADDDVAAIGSTTLTAN